MTDSIDFRTTHMLRDAKGDPIPQVWDEELRQFVPRTTPEGMGGSGGSAVGDTISADNVRDGVRKSVPTHAERTQITTNAQSINSHAEKLSEIDEQLSNLPQNGLVKLTANDVATFLADKLDRATFDIVNGQLVVIHLAGLHATTVELNLLQGARAPIQAQLDALSNVTGTKEVVDAFADLPQPVPSSGTVLVRRDEQHDNKTTFYSSNGTVWQFVDEIESGLARDFTLEPIDLATEVMGILPKANYEKPVASDITIADAANNFSSKNVELVLAELFQYADSIKTSWASVVGLDLTKNNSAQEFKNATQVLKNELVNNLLEKRVIASPSMPLAQLIAFVLNIPNVSVTGVFEEIAKVNVTAPHVQDIVLKEPLSPTDVAVSIIEHVPGESGVIQYSLAFNNSDASGFEPNEYVIFDGKMRLKTDYELDVQTDATWTDIGKMQFVEVDTTEFARVDGVSFE